MRHEAEVWRALGRLTPTEKRIKDAFPVGALVDLRSGDPALDDPAHAADWPRSRTVRAEVPAALLLDGVPAEPGRIAALRVNGARVVGPLVLAHGTVRSAWILEDCFFTDPIDLEGADSGPVQLRRSRLAGLLANYAHIRGLLALTEATVAGDVYAPGVMVDGNLRCRALRVAGTVNLNSAMIAGLASFIDAEIVNPGGVTLHASGIRVRRNMNCDRLTSVGHLRIYSAEIGGTLNFGAATLDGRDNEKGQAALGADGITVGSNLWFRADEGKPFEAHGTIVLTGSRVGRDVSFSGARLSAPDEEVLVARRMRVAGNVYLGDGFTTTGAVRLTAAHVEGHLNLDGIDAPTGLLGLRMAQIPGGIRDAGCAWPGRVDLDGLTHGLFANYAPARDRLPIIGRQIHDDATRIGGFRAQPYEHLAAYYRELGQDGQARSVLLAKARASRRVQPWYRRIGGYLIDAMVGYGYRPSRAFGWALALLAFGGVYFARVGPPQRVSTEDTSVFDPVVYTADRLVPLVHLGSADVWQFHGAAAVVSGVLTVLGWTLSIAIAAGVTRVLSRN